MWACAASSAHAIVLAGVADPGPTFTPSSTIRPATIVTQPFTLDMHAANVQVRAMVDYFSGVGPIDVFLTTQVGLTTTLDHLVASGTFNPPDRAFFTAFNLDYLAAGSYSLTLFNRAEPPIAGWPFVGSGTPIVTGTVGTHGFINSPSTNTAFPPANAFTFPTSGGRFHLFDVRGDVINFAPPEDSGLGTKVNIDTGEILGNGVSTEGKRTFHRLTAQSVNASAAAMDMGSAERAFTFERVDGQDDPIFATIFGDLTGDLITDNLGFASVQAQLVLKDALGNVLGMDSINLSSNAGIGFLEEVDVNTRLQIVAELIPGNLYTLFSKLTVNASSPLGGAGRALFDNTFTVDLDASTIVPEPSALVLWTGLALVWLASPRQRVTQADPEKVTVTKLG
jgi:hypothetical protein